MRRPLSEVLIEARAWIRKSGLPHKELAIKAGIDVASIYRLMDDSGVRVKYGSALKQICRIADIQLEIVRQERLPRELQLAVLDAWDGTPAHARRLAGAIRALGDYTRSAVRWE